MSHVVSYKNEHLLFAPNIHNHYGIETIAPVDYWVCSQGLVIWLSPMAPAMIDFFDGKPAGAPGMVTYGKCILLDLDGRIFHIEATLDNSEKPGGGDERYACQLPTGKDVQWVKALDNHFTEKAAAALLLSDDLEECHQIMIKSDIFCAKHYRWFKVEDLLTMVNNIHKTKYPEHPRYKETKTPA